MSGHKKAAVYGCKRRPGVAITYLLIGAARQYSKNGGPKYGRCQDPDCGRYQTIIKRGYLETVVIEFFFIFHINKLS
jgi:hypothetical protein